MTDDRWPHEDAFVLLVETIADLDAVAARSLTSDLLDRFDAEDAEAAAEELLDLYVGDDDPDADPDWAAQAHALLRGVLVWISERFDAPACAIALVDEAAQVLDDDPAEASRLAARGVQVADVADLAGYAGAWHAIALARHGRLADALPVARLAHERTDSAWSRSFSAEALLVVLLELGHPDATQVASAALAECPADPDETFDSLGQAITRALIAEAARLEEAGVQPPLELAEQLRRCLSHPAWTPDGLTRHDLAALVAWTDYLRHDLSRLDETIALAGNGPFLNDELAAHVAFLSVLGPYERQDLTEMERRLRLAAPVLTRADNGDLWAVFDSLDAGLAATLRGSDYEARMAALTARLTARGVPTDPFLRLFPRAYGDVSAVLDGRATTVSAEVREALDDWCEGVHYGDAVGEATLWAIAAVASFFDGDVVTASSRLDRAEAVREELPAGSSLRGPLDMMLDAVRPGLLMVRDPHEGLERYEAVLAEHEREGRVTLAYLTAVQLAVGLLGTGDAAGSLRVGVKALGYLERYRVGLLGSSERSDLHGQQVILFATVLKAGLQCEDLAVVAETLEFIRAQDLPHATAEVLPGSLPFSAVRRGGLRVPSPEPGPVPDAVTIGLPSAVRMPWGRVALSSLLPAAGRRVVDLVVPRAD